MDLRAFVDRKLALAWALAAGECGGTYTDAHLILAAIVSSMAADLWKGEKIDRARFIELWARDSDPFLHPNRISLPLLCRYLRAQGRPDEAKDLEAGRPNVFRPGYDALVASGAQIDMDEFEVRQYCPLLTPREIRKFSYPGIYYDQFRCATSHEYELGPDAVSNSMRADAEISYVNRVYEGGRVERLIHFHVPWLESMIRSMAVTVEPEIDSGRKIPLVWWSGGG